MIDFASDELLTLGQAAELVPGRQAGKGVHIQTVYRWATRGCRGVVLETVVVGGRRCTTWQALVRFFRELTEDVSGAEPVACDLPVAKAKTEDVLTRAGITE